MPSPVYTSLADLQEYVGGEDALKLIADPDFGGDSIDTGVVNSALSWAEGEVLKKCRGVDAAGLGTWENTPSAIPEAAKQTMLCLGVFGVHERIRAAQGVAIPRDVIASKDRAYKELAELGKLGADSWAAGVTPAQHLTQQVTVNLDTQGRGRQTRTSQIFKLIR